MFFKLKIFQNNGFLKWQKREKALELISAKKIETELTLMKYEYRKL